MSDLKEKEPQNLTSAAERQFERWLLSPELREFMQSSHDVSKQPVQTAPYIAISREAGAGGGHIARLVGALLEWDVLDKELLDFMTQRYSLSRQKLDVVDEAATHWFQDALRTFFESKLVSRDDYAIHLERIIWLAALHGKVVLVGRGAHCILPRENGLAIRIVASKEYRIHRVMERRDLSETQARKTINATDQGREQFCQTYFHHDNRDPYLYYLIINVERIPHELAAQKNRRHIPTNSRNGIAVTRTCLEGNRQHKCVDSAHGSCGIARSNNIVLDLRIGTKNARLKWRLIAKFISRGMSGKCFSHKYNSRICLDCGVSSFLPRQVSFSAC